MSQESSTPQTKVSGASLNPFRNLRNEKPMLMVLAVLAVFSAVIAGQPMIAMWVGFAFAGYSAIANDSIQTIGTFIASNKERPWWQLWIFISGVFFFTMYASWSTYGGPVYMDLAEIKDTNGQLLTADARDVDGKIQTVLRISLAEEGSDKVKYSQIPVDIADGQLVDRESLGFDVSKDWTIQSIQLGSLNLEADKVDGFKPLKQPVYATGKAAEQNNGKETWSMYTVGATEGASASLGEVKINSAFGGDVSNQRLASKGFATQPNSFSFLHLLAPLVLILFTRLRMPVSTTFLLLSCFAYSGKSIMAVTTKSLSGYVIAFVGAIILWGLLGKAMSKWFTGPANPMWRVAQWCTTGWLWSVWLMQDAANIAVYLPRALTTLEFTAFCGVIILGLGWLFRSGGEKIQEVVHEKASVVDVRAATVIDFLYAGILYYFKFKSNIPMSTTWVFVGLLGGRELAMAWWGVSGDGRTLGHAFRLVLRDLIYVTIGFLVSLLIAGMINPTVGRALFG